MYNNISITDIINNKIHFNKTMIKNFWVEKTQTFVRLRLDNEKFWPEDVVVRFDNANTYITIYGCISSSGNALYTFNPKKAPALLKRIKNYVIFCKKH